MNKKINNNRKNQNESIDRDFLSLISSTYSMVLDHIKQIKNDSKGNDQKYLDDLKEVLKYNCQLKSVVCGMKNQFILKDIQ